MLYAPLNTLTKNQPNPDSSFMSTSTDNNEVNDSKTSHLSKSKLANLIRHYSFNIPSSSSMRIKLKDRLKTNQIHAFTPSSDSSSAAKHHHHHQLSTSDDLLLCGIPTTDSLEPPIDPFLKSVDFVDSLAQLYKKVENCSDSNKYLVYLEQYAMLCSIGDPKLLRKCLQSARKHAPDVHSKVVLSAWLRYERREDELVGKSKSTLDCIGRNLECPSSALLNAYDPNSVFENCHCSKETHSNVDCIEIEISPRNHLGLSTFHDNVCFLIGNEKIHCDRAKMASLSRPLKTMLYGNFMESADNVIDFSNIGISVEGMRAVRLFTESRRIDSCSPNIVLDILSFSNRFCCEELKCACDNYLYVLISNIDEALLLIDYALEERAYLLTASCLQMILRELPKYLYTLEVINIFCSFEARERLVAAGHASFVLYYFLSQVAMEDNMKSNVTLMLLERLRDSANETWEKALALHLLGCVFLERKEYKDAQNCFEVAAEIGHVYSIVGAARARCKQGQRFLAYDMIHSVITNYKPIGWMYQERSLYNLGIKKILDLDEATRLDPTLAFPYKYRAVNLIEENQIEAAILEISRIIAFRVSSDSLEFRAWFHIIKEDYSAAMRDIRALLTLEPNYLMMNKKVRGDHLVELLSQHVDQWSPADCWMQLYDRWSSVDDIGSLAVIHQMLVNDPGKSILWFRQSLLLLRLNCQKAAMHSLRLARNHSSSNYEKLVYEGWILYDTGYREEALSKAEESISIQRSFEAFFLKAYILADTFLNSESATYVVDLLDEALKCPSDGLRKGQALNNLGSIYVDCGKLDMAADCYVNALKIKHTRAHQGLARVYHLKNESKSAYDEMTKLIEKAQNKASAYEKRSEYCCERDLTNNDLSMATEFDPTRTYPYRYRAAVFMDDQRESEAVEELTRAMNFKPDLQMLNLRAAFHESMGDFSSALRDCEAALCLDPSHKDTLDLYTRARTQATSVRFEKMESNKEKGT